MLLRKKIVYILIFFISFIMAIEGGYWMYLQNQQKSKLISPKATDTKLRSYFMTSPTSVPIPTPITVKIPDTSITIAEIKFDKTLPEEGTGVYALALKIETGIPKDPINTFWLNFDKGILSSFEVYEIINNKEVRSDPSRIKNGDKAVILMYDDKDNRVSNPFSARKIVIKLSE